ncbi:hypothetical protein SAMN05880582_101834 [Rhizobium sp. RU20A]|uniref:PAS domain-containing protein n=1 Tax=Rhizobium sp. RU20A TaxID=1907412 RepID=UPI000955C85A|nr:PAS domain-containing protein [Rhizobium sp. RU20A]SIQ12582.1 hypothetical protein SAMN05880582_101834 [Rhizobium sp. RU20A]
MGDRLSTQLFHYWTSLRAAQRMPLRTQIDPAALSQQLPDLFILEALTGGEHRFRLAGTRMCHLFGRELRHALFSSLWRDDQARQTDRTAQRILQTAVPIRFSADSRNRLGDRVRLEIALFPLADPDGVPARLIGALDILETPFQQAFLPLSTLEQTGLSTMEWPEPQGGVTGEESTDDSAAWKNLVRRIARSRAIDDDHAKI